jgi:hypothetical protein
MMKKIVYCCIAVIFASSCGTDEQKGSQDTSTETPVLNKIEQLNWVLGTWQNVTPDGTFTEHWERAGEGLFSGHGSFVSPKGDTLFSEYIELEAVNDTLYYKPVVSGQNDGKETVFEGTAISSDEAVFENPAHDFPQRIIYQKPTDSTLYARIEGIKDGVEKQEEFSFKKVK